MSLRVKETDSFGVELTKNFAQSAIGSAVATAGFCAGLAVVGMILDKRKPVFLKPNETVVTKTENE